MQDRRGPSRSGGECLFCLHTCSVLEKTLLATDICCPPKLSGNSNQPIPHYKDTYTQSTARLATQAARLVSLMLVPVLRPVHGSHTSSACQSSRMINRMCMLLMPRSNWTSRTGESYFYTRFSVELVNSTAIDEKDRAVPAIRPNAFDRDRQKPTTLLGMSSPDRSKMTRPAAPKACAYPFSISSNMLLSSDVTRIFTVTIRQPLERCKSVFGTDNPCIKNLRKPVTRLCHCANCNRCDDK